MLIAAHTSGLIDASEATRGLDYWCPACQQPVVLHHGSQIPPYFAHHPQTPCHLAGEGETRQHLLGKRQLATFFSDWGTGDIRAYFTGHSATCRWVVGLTSASGFGVSV
ncbi:competence protein CoiA family protein [Levilactobacillus brevis]|uniref:competence protein CoiA family protein n=1 Tax=Levilactobacillus brevis TaxID=1580 RepID=UPI0022A787C9|nr:competence protein CoiA family protein [Levilactobacillus brevis]